MATADLHELRRACADLARTTMWDLRPVDNDRIQALTRRLLDEATKRVELIDASEDPAVVTRAVRFLGSTYAIPPMKDDTPWFEQALDLLLHLVHPNTAPDEVRQQRPFSRISKLESVEHVHFEASYEARRLLRPETNCRLTPKWSRRA